MDPAIHISWEKDLTRGEHLINWLSQNPVQRTKLFSDSTVDAAKDGHCKLVTKSPKSILVPATITVFLVDADEHVCADLALNGPGKYVKAIENYVKQ